MVIIGNDHGDVTHTRISFFYIVLDWCFGGREYWDVLVVGGRRKHDFCGSKLVLHLKSRLSERKTELIYKDSII